MEKDNRTFEELKHIETWTSILEDGIIKDYLISNLGRIRNIKRNNTIKKAGSDTQGGMCQVYLKSVNGKYKLFNLRNLVVNEFIRIPNNDDILIMAVFNTKKTFDNFDINQVNW